ncbi:MAG TPA: hypothetical protein VNS55_09075 [Nocardioides sp.]|nr:hypothetical protein [Nocardioides sp.]
MTADHSSTDTIGRRTLRFRRRLAPILVDGPPTGLARAYDVDSGGHLVTELVPRVTLEDLVRMGPLPHEAAFDALRDVAAELEAMAAEAGEAHGDVKPWNVYVLPDGHATIGDPHEQERAERPAGATRRGDAYWFGVLVCEVLTGIRPIDRPDAARLMAEAGLPEPVRATILRALQPRPQRRPLPHHLVAALDALPAGTWLPDGAADRAVDPGGPAGPDGPVGPADPVDGPAPATGPAEDLAPVEVPEPEEDPQPVVVLEPVEEDLHPEQPAEPVRRRVPLLRRLGRYVAALGALLVVAGAVTGARMLGFLEPAAVGTPAAVPVGVQRVALFVTPPRTHCPRAHITLTSTVVTDGRAGTVTLHWQLPGGQLLADDRVEVADGVRRTVVSTDVTVLGQRALRGHAVVTVSPGATRATAPFRFDCR